MGQARVGDDGIRERQQKIAAWEAQIAIWALMSEKSKALDKLKEATDLGRQKVEREILDRVKTLSFGTDADKLDLAKLAGKLDGLESVYYDIADAPKKIEGARQIIAKLVDEIKRAKKGELIETKA